MSSARKTRHVRDVSTSGRGDRGRISARFKAFECVPRNLLRVTVSAAALFSASPDAHARPLGNFAPAPSAAAIAASQSGSQDAARAARDAQNALKRATLAIQAMQSVQSAARDAAKAQLNAMPSITNGLGLGGLQIGAGVKLPDGHVDSSLWQGANLPTEFTDGDRSKVTVEQTQTKAILTWDTFHVGAGTDLTFDQKGNSNWVALNRVLGTDARPSQILGNIKADGQVYIVNQNGIIFGGASQVNVGALIASTANISKEQFLNSGIYSTQNGASYVPSFTDADGAVKVEAGALITTNTPTSVTAGGGFVLLMGSQVENAGSIATPRGQTMLAAGDDFILRRGYGTDANQASTTNGNEIATIIRAGSLSGGVTNNGLVFSQQGDITLAGRAIAQNGILVSTTSVNTRGTIHLLNSASDTSGSVILGVNSVSTIIPELDSAEAALNSQRDALIAASGAVAHQPVASVQFDNLSLLADRLDQSRIEIVTGGNAIFKGGSLTIAQGGQVAVSAGRRIFTEDGATIDVSGVRDVTLPMSANNIMINVQGNELRDTPVNRDNDYLKNANVWIDIRDLIFVSAGTGGYASDRYYTPGGLLEVGGYLANTAHKIGEWAALGGTIMLSAPEVIAQAGAVFDISGGSVTFEPGKIRTTNFLGADGKLYNINNARGDMTFYGLGQGWIRKSERWGVTDVYIGALGRGRETVRWEEGYTVGRDAGRLVLSTPTAIFEGKILADVVTGERQHIARPTTVTDGYKLTQNTAAQAGTLTLGQYGALGRTNLFNSDIRISDIANVADNLTADDALAAGRGNTVWFDAHRLTKYGLGRLELGTRDAITIDSDLTLANGGALDMTAAIIDIAANVTAHGGSVTMTNVFVAPLPGSLGEGLTKGGMSSLTLRDGAAIDTAGVWANALLDRSALSMLGHLDGGSVSLQSTHDIVLEQGSLIDVSSGGAILSDGKTKGGKGGNVTLSGQPLNGSVRTAALALDGDIRGYGVTGAGALTLAASSVLIAAPGSSPTAGRVLLTPEFFRRGFSKYDINGYTGVTVADGTQIDVVAPVYQFADASYVTRSGDRLSALQAGLQPLYIEDPARYKITQRTGADLILRSQRLVDGGIISVGTGATITVDPGRTISLLGGALSQIVVDGTLNAFGGSIDINIEGALFTSTSSVSQQALHRSIWIGESAVLDVAARAVTAIDLRGRTYGQVQAGGTIAIGGGLDWEATGEANAQDVAVIIRPGAVLDASGTHAMLGVAGSNGFAQVDVASNGGSIVLKSAHSLYLDGTFSASAGGAGAAGGTLGIALETPVFSSSRMPDNEVLQSREFILSQVHQGSGLGTDLRFGEADPALVYGAGRIGADQVANGGFGNLSLLVNGILSFDGNVTLSTSQSLRIYAGSYALSEAAASNARVALASSYVRLAAPTRSPGDREFMPTVTWRSGASTRGSDATFSVEADQIDIRDRVGFGAHGQVAMKTGPAVVTDRRGFDAVEVTSRGDLRLLGGREGLGLTGSTTTELRTMGDLTITAAQIFPDSNVHAQIVAGYDVGRILEIRRGRDGDIAAPFSVFGRLALGGNIVRQGGVVRAPMGNLIFGQDSRATYEAHASLVELLPGSVTSVSAAGLLMPYGGTVDGLTYNYAGKAITPRALGASGITLTGDSVIGQAGSVLDLSGGGELSGAGFVSGRGGSVDIIRTPLANANPGFSFSSSRNGVYAIVPSFAGGFAPSAPDAADPVIGQQITLATDVGGLKAGTYTLLPATYALLPGAFRLELGAANPLAGETVAIGNGSYATSGFLGIAHTSVRSTVANQVIVTPAKSVKLHSSYNTMGFDEYVLADTVRRGGIRGELLADAHNLLLDFGYSRPRADLPMLQFDGKALFNPAVESKGFGGTVALSGFDIEILDAGGQATTAPNRVSIYADQLNAFGAPRLLIGGKLNLEHAGTTATFQNNTFGIIVRSGAALTGAEVFLVSGMNGITVEQGASINTLSAGAPAYDSTDGVVFSAGNSSVLAVSNGWINMLPPTADGGRPGSILVGECPTANCTGDTTILARGTIAVGTDQAFTFADNVRYGARNLVLAVSSVNLGSDAALAQAAANDQLPSGLSMNQGILARLLAGNAGAGIPAVETLVLNVRESVNIYGSVTLDTVDPATGVSSIERLVLGTPAIFGYGSATDKAVITTEEFVWTGLAMKPATRYGDVDSPNTPGAAIGDLLGSSTLDVSASRILLGYGPNTQPETGYPADRLAVGFGIVNLTASEYISANAKGTLGVYHQQGSFVAGEGYTYSGGDLNLTAPLLTGEAGSVNRITAGGDIVFTSRGADLTTRNAMGAELALSGRNVIIDGNVDLASGKLVLSAVHDLILSDNSRIDLSGRAVSFFEQTRYSRGGDLLLSSMSGNITQSAGALIDLSAEHNRGGTLQATALAENAGRVDLAGYIKGSASGQYDAGGTIVPYDAAEITIRAQMLPDFAGLNARLNTGEVFGARHFQIKQGNLTVGDEVKARSVEIVVDGGNLTVDGRIDASGYQVGTIRLAASNDLIINGTLDAHGIGLRRDSYGQIIESPNRAIVELTTRSGTLTLTDNAVVDLRAGTEAIAGYDGLAGGTLDLNAPRLGGTGGQGGVDSAGNGADDVAVNVIGTPLIRGAKSVAVNAFRIYDDAPLASAPDTTGYRAQEITQAYLDGIDLHNTAFIDAALANTSLSNRLAGLGSYRLRPGVEIVSNPDPLVNPNGDLTIVGDIDLSGYRYGPGSDRVDPSRRGFGEPGSLVIRAAGNINIYGSINDGFAPPPQTPDDTGWYLTELRTQFGTPHTPFGADIVIPIDGVVLDKGTVFPAGSKLTYDVPSDALTLPSGTIVPVDVTLTANYTLPGGTVLAANVYNADGSIAHAAGKVMKQDTVLSDGMKLGAGTVLRGAAEVAALIWPKGVTLPVAITANDTIALARGAVIPGMTSIELIDDKAIDLRPTVDGVQGRNWALAPMLEKGATSWTMQLTAGGDLASSNRRAVVPGARGSIILADGHAMVDIKTVMGGTGQVWTDDAAEWGFEPGAAISEFDIIFCDFMSNFCTTDPARFGYVWGPDGSMWDPSFVEGTPVDDLWRDVGICDFTPGTCVQIINPVKDVTKHTYLAPVFSVVRTGTGDLGAAAAGDFRMESAFGFYTAGSRSAALTGPGGTDPFNLPRGLTEGTLIGPQTKDYSAALAAYQAWYPDHGGNLDIAVGGSIVGDIWGGDGGGARPQIASVGVGNWLWRQGTGSAAIGADSVPTAWWINFGTYIKTPYITEYNDPYLAGFTGLGTLGGGNLTIRAGGDAGIIDARGERQDYPRSQGLVAAVGSTGRVDASGNLTLTGGGDLSIQIGGSINPNLKPTQGGSPGANTQYNDLNGALINLRGVTSVVASAIGGVDLTYGRRDFKDVRPNDPFTATAAISAAGLVLMPGDSAVYLNTPGDLVVASVSDPGRVTTPNTSGFTAGGVTYDGGGESWFSLWTERTSVNLFSAGGNLTPGTDVARRTAFNGSNTVAGDIRATYPSILRATAAAGSIYYGHAISGVVSTSPWTMVLAPSASGALEFLAGTSLFGGGYAISMSGSDTPMPTPFNPAFIGWNGRPISAKLANTSREGTRTDNGLFEGVSTIGQQGSHPLFAFGPDTLGSRDLHAGDRSPSLFYAVNGDILGLQAGEVRQFDTTRGRSVLTWYEAATSARIRAGRDIVGSGGLILNNNSVDVSIIQAGRDITYANWQIAGPGWLEITAGRDIYQGDAGSITSLGALISGDLRPGAGIAMMAGTGASGPDYQALLRYLDPANHLAAGTPLDGSGKVAKTYEKELAAWMKQRYGFAGVESDVLASFVSLAPEQQRVFLRQVYFAETTAGGREFNDAASARYGSYMRGRDMIGTLFPVTDAGGRPTAYFGDITMFGGSGVRTLFGGDIQMLTPSGKLVIGVEGVVPPASAGLITQGSGDIQLYSKGSILLGLSRIMTTFGGNILAWSAEGDINAGRGAKTSVLYTPPKRVYDNFGNVTLSPQAPSSGAGIATLNPIPQIPAGSIDLIAPLGAIDAGEAGIRSSGNVNLAALQIFNAANIQAQGNTTGVTQVQAPNIGGLTQASNTAGAAAQQAATPGQGSGSAQPSIIIVEVLGFGGGSGGAPESEEERHRRTQGPQSYDTSSPFQVVGAGSLNQAADRYLTDEEKRALRR